MHDGVGVLYATWYLVCQNVTEGHPAFETLTYYFAKTSNRCRKVLERLYKSHAFEVIESLIEYWNIDKVSFVGAFVFRSLTIAGKGSPKTSRF